MATHTGRVGTTEAFYLGTKMIKPSCYSCRKKFEPAALRVSYSKNYCEGCGVGLFGDNYFGFARKPAPTTRKNLTVHFMVLVITVAGLSLWYWGY